MAGAVPALDESAESMGRRRERSRMHPLVSPGQRIGDAPVFDGVCARCGQLLYGHVNRATATTGNKHVGAAMNIKSEPCSAKSQPPFFLRWPPSHLAEFLPDVFAHEARTNRLSLREHHRASPPWKARPHHRRAQVSDQWLYCSTCHGTLFENEEKQSQCAVPFRDAASLANVRGVAMPRGVLDVDDVWSRATADAVRANPQRGGSLSFANLVPSPDPSRWRTTPEGRL